MMAAGGAAALRTLDRRQAARADDRMVSIVVGYDDVQAVSVRTGLSLAELLPKLRASGATHCALPERTLMRMLGEGQMFQTIPREPHPLPPPFGRWVYLSGADTDCVHGTVQELQARLPHIGADSLPGDAHTLSFAGDLEVVGSIGLGFDAELAELIHRSGLGVVPRPVSYDWHERALIERTLAQAAGLGDGIVAFDGDLILGHEMHLSETLSALEAHDLTFAYFAESRHQRGDWFIAKRRMPHVVSAHQFTPAQMIPEDYHSLAHHWANLARERGVRMMFADFFRVVHATEPLECLKYLEHMREAVEGEGFRVGIQAPRCQTRNFKTHDANAASRGANLASLVPVGAGTLAVGKLLGLNDALTVSLAGVGALGSLSLTGLLDRARDALEEQYPPAYASKVISLAATTLAPLAALAVARSYDDPAVALLLDGVIGASTAAAVAAMTSSDEYRLRVEEYKGFDLDVWLPLAGAILSFAFPEPVRASQRDARALSDKLPLRSRLLAMTLKRGSTRPARHVPMAAGTRFVLGTAVSMAGWYLTRRLAPDPCARLDMSPAMSHTHHLSAAMRHVGDIMLAVGPRPIRKWAGLAPFGLALNIAAREEGMRAVELAGAMLSAAGHAAAITGFRRPERDPQLTARAVGGSWLLGIVAGLSAVYIIRGLKAGISVRHPK
jgi:hypothetical protein